MPIYAEDAVLEKAGVQLDKETGKPIGQEGLDQDEGKPKGVTKDEERSMSAFTDFVSTLDLEDLGKQ